MSSFELAPQPRARRFADIALATLVLLVVGMMVVPLPTPLLDILIAGNICLGVLLLLVALHIEGGVQFSSFPTVLLVTTLYRLALNVSSTRLILLDADAGSIIRAFGDFMVQGNYVVGAVVFLIITLIQFLVVAKGSERVAEVGARFTLDAMPGKQMSIDAELRAGALSQDQARQKRAALQRESQFYGAMDGAMKFVKGDAIAGIVITVINILGGLAIGVAMKDMSAGEALQTYGLLTIGDGLVSQIPALLISTSAGLVVTRVASEHEQASLGGDVAKQIFGNPRALRIGAVFLVALGAVPGLPAIPFFVLAALLFAATDPFRTKKKKRRPATPGGAVSAGETVRQTRPQGRVPLVVPVSVDVALDLAESVADEDGAGPLLDEEIPRLRDTLFFELGLALPAVRARTRAGLAPAAYEIAIQEVPVVRAELGGELLALASAAKVGELGLLAREAIDPLNEQPASWVDAAAADALTAAGIETLTPAAVVARHAGLVVRRRAQDLVGIQEVQLMLDQLERAYPALVRNVLPKPVSLPLLTDILRRLVEESVSIRPLREILETLATHAPTERDPVTLTELVRAGLKRQITHRHAPEGALHVHLLDPAIEEAVRDSIQRTPGGSYLALPPSQARDIIGAAKEALGNAPALVLTQADIRRFVRRLFEVELPGVQVLSFQELSPEADVQPLGRIGV